MKNEESKIMTLNTRDILVDPVYQRPLNPAKISRIVKKFNPMLVNLVKVSFRDGQYYVYDGQHTIAALKVINGGKDVDVRCSVRFGLTQLDEAELFLLQNGESSSVETIDKLRTKFNTGNKDVIAMVRIAEKCGFVVDFQKGQNRWRIIAVNTLFSLFGKMTRDQFTAMLTVIRNAWDGDAESLRREILSGTGLFIQKYWGEFRQKDLEKTLQKIQPIAIIRDGRGLGVGSHDNTSYARAILRAYNKNRTSRRLEDRF